MSFFVATRDQFCPHWTAKKYIKQIESETVTIDVKGVGHEWFHTGANSDWFMKRLIEQLQVPKTAFEEYLSQVAGLWDWIHVTDSEIRSQS